MRVSSIFIAYFFYFFFFISFLGVHYCFHLFKGILTVELFFFFFLRKYKLIRYYICRYVCISVLSIFTS